jgi:hypothetical protein
MLCVIILKLRSGTPDNTWKAKYVFVGFFRKNYTIFDKVLTKIPYEQPLNRRVDIYDNTMPEDDIADTPP